MANSAIKGKYFLGNTNNRNPQTIFLSRTDFLSKFAPIQNKRHERKKLTLLVILLLILDQALKIWVKTHMTLGEAIILIPDWFQLYFIENKGAAFGMHIATPGTMDWGKLLLGLFRIGMVVALIWLIRHFMRKKRPKEC